MKYIIFSKIYYPSIFKDYELHLFINNNEIVYNDNIVHYHLNYFKDFIKIELSNKKTFVKILKLTSDEYK